MHYKLVLYGLIPFYLLHELTGGLVAAAIVPAMCFTLIYVLIRGKWPISIMIFLAVTAIATRPLMSEYRQLTWYVGANVGASTLEKSQILLDLLTQRYTQESATAESLEIATNRTNQLATLAWVVNFTPSTVPYWNGLSYLSLPMTLVPRAIWPNKPEQEFGQVFGHTYEFLDADDNTTSINFPQLVEAYVNFGVPGYVLPMVVIGFLYRFLNNLGTSPPAQLSNIVLKAFLASSLMNMESNLGLVLGALIQNYIVIVVTSKIIDRFSKREASR
jgi:hypothetical protein